ncbi:MAG: hypothetical protein V9G63_13535 [Candidatus Competibacter sp.]
MPTTLLPFPSEDTIGLVVRGKTSPSHDPGALEQHADCILADGSPVGFFGEAGAGSSGRSGSGSWNSTGMNMKGVVYDYPLFKIHRPFYVGMAEAKRYSVKSTVLVITVSKAQALLFKDYWNKLKANPGSFYLLGHNCSTHASDAFIYAGIITGGIPGLDTPNNLYKQLVTSFTQTVSHSGFLGFTPKAAGGYEVAVES